MALVGVSVAQPASALLTSTAFDPTGDTCCNAPTYQDIVGASVTLKSKTFIFRMQLAGELPTQPSLPPPGVAEIWWSWGVDLDSATSIGGYPLASPSPPLSSELLVVIKSDGSAYSAFSVDRRPLQTRQDPIIAPIPFAISGTEVDALISSATAGNPSSFRWQVITFDWANSPPSNGATAVDGLAQFANWPS